MILQGISRILRLEIQLAKFFLKASVFESQNEKNDKLEILKVIWR